MMKEFIFCEQRSVIPVIVEPTAYKGVRKIADKVMRDVFLVCGSRPDCFSNLDEIPEERKHTIVIFATFGKSPLLDELTKHGLISNAEIAEKREVFGVAILEHPWEEVEKALVIYGSDKRGTIYGMFHLSELLGVSPLHYWGDAVPEKRETIVFDKGIEMVSKEPSVKYRGFFINDEWPCFGSWTFESFGGFTAEMYEHVFELLLRLKGNYLWTAMWTSSFALDGPGLKNAELADLYGVVIGHSHHEPCLRASEEWDIYRGKDSGYGDKWNFYTNREGLLRYWADGLKRSGKYEGIVTIGMRGERDSSMLGPDASLGENIELLKDIITEQNKLIKKHVNSNLEQVPRLLALYKEVEAYFYGDGEAPGLIGWEELEDVILMLCEDNFGNMRTLPTETMRSHSGGFGMYYHFDYHGDPISYEWVNSTPLTKVWEQMTMAYEYGVREAWVVNVGDLKFNEFPLSYFLSLAYDFETWGSSAPNTTEDFTEQWMRQQFGSRIDEAQFHDLVKVHNGYIRANGMRKPEALNSHVYHPVQNREADRMLLYAGEIIEKADYLLKNLPAECLDAYYSMIYYPAKASMNLLQMHLYAGKNEHYAKQGKKLANDYGDKVTECIEEDRRLADEFGAAFHGKWNGMQKAQHIGFTKWNEDNYRYPIRMKVEPAYKPRMVVSRADGEAIAVKDYFAPMVIEVRDFTSLPDRPVEIEIANDGIGSFSYRVEMEPCGWLSFHGTGDTVKTQEILTLCCDRSMLPEEETMHEIILSGEETRVVLQVYGKAAGVEGLPGMTFIENQGVVAMEAEHVTSLKEGAAGGLVVLKDFGRSGSGIKAWPFTETFEPLKGPSAVYTVCMERAGNYVLELWTAPSNPLKKGSGLCCGIRINNGEFLRKDTLPRGFMAGVAHNAGWSEGVLNQVRVSSLDVALKKGINHIEYFAIDPGVVLERLVVYPVGHCPDLSYLGPEESYYVKA